MVFLYWLPHISHIQFVQAMAQKILDIGVLSIPENWSTLPPLIACPTNRATWVTARQPTGKLSRISQRNPAHRIYAGHRKITVTTMVSCLSIWALLKLFRRKHISSLRHDGSHCNHVLTRFPVIPPLIMDSYIEHLSFLHLSPSADPREVPLRYPCSHCLMPGPMLSHSLLSIPPPAE